MYYHPKYRAHSTGSAKIILGDKWENIYILVDIYIAIYNVIRMANREFKFLLLRTVK